MSISLIKSDINVIKYDTQDEFLIITDFFLVNKFYDFYYKYLTELNKICDLILGLEEVIQENSINDLHKKNKGLIKMVKNEITQISSNFNSKVYDDFINKKLYVEHNSFLRLGCSLLRKIESFDYDYFLESANEEWLIKKLKIEYYLEKNINLMVSSSCNKLPWYENWYNKICKNLSIMPDNFDIQLHSNSYSY